MFEHWKILQRAYYTEIHGLYFDKWNRVILFSGDSEESYMLYASKLLRCYKICVRGSREKRNACSYIILRWNFGVIWLAKVCLCLWKVQSWFWTVPRPEKRPWRSAASTFNCDGALWHKTFVAYIMLSTCAESKSCDRTITRTISLNSRAVQPQQD